MSALILKLRVRLFRLCVHRRHPRLETIYSLALACHHLASPPAPSPTPIGETQVMTQVSPVPSPPTPRHPKKALLIGICGTGDNFSSTMFSYLRPTQTVPKIGQAGTLSKALTTTPKPCINSSSVSDPSRRVLHTILNPLPQIVTTTLAKKSPCFLTMTI